MGIAVQLLITAIGLASRLRAVAEAFEWIRRAGAAVLVYLGIRPWRGEGESLQPDTTAVYSADLFVQGLVITIPNPKRLIFIAAFRPQFIDAARPPGWPFASIVPAFLVITFSVTSVWALAAGNARELLRCQRVIESVRRTAGGLMIVAGLGLAMARRGN